MSLELLLRQLSQISDAPAQIEMLRQFVLDLAVRGRLVAQSSVEASDSGVATGDPGATTLSESLGFAVPPTWAQALLVDLCEVSFGFAFDSERFALPGIGLPLIRIRDISSLDTQAYFAGAFDDRYLVETGDYLVGMDGDFNLRKWRGPRSLLNQRVMRLRQWSPLVTAEWVEMPLQMILNRLHRSTSQTTVKHLSAKQVNRVWIPIPPREEQQRIIAKVDELMALLDELEEAQRNREHHRDLLRSTSLRNLVTPERKKKTDEFFVEQLPRLLATPDQVIFLRRAIFDLAVQGRLVPQDSGEEPAFAWLDRLSATKHVDAAAGHRLLGWAMVTLADIAPRVTSGSRGWAQFYSEEGALFVRSQNVKYGSLLMSDRQHVSPPANSEGTRTRIEVGDLLVVITGDVGHIAVWDRDLGEAYVSQHVALAKPLSPDVSPWLRLVMMAPSAGRSQLRASIYGGKPGLNLKQVRSTVVPLPPQREQARIVERVNELMIICDQLEDALARKSIERPRLLTSLLRDALEASADGESVTSA